MASAHEICAWRPSVQVRGEGGRGGRPSVQVREGQGGQGGFIEQFFDISRDTFPVFLKQLQLLPSACGLTGLECSRIAALLGVMESAMCLGAVTPDLLRVGGGETLPAPAVGWTHAAGMLPPLIHTLITWTKRYVTTAPNMVY